MCRWHTKMRLFVKPGKYVQGPPAVKYRGIFLNDEAPIRLDRAWEVPGKSDPPVCNYNHQFYTNVFELLLRLKGNYLWPAMWNNAFNEDDPVNPKLADEYGIVMGTSHHEPMLRAQKEWNAAGQQRTLGIEFAKYPDVLENFWREGIERNKNYESIITIGMRGDGDTPDVRNRQHRAAGKNRGRPKANHRRRRCTPTPQPCRRIWALYKEVQEYYEKGMRVPGRCDAALVRRQLGQYPPLADRRKTGSAAAAREFIIILITSAGRATTNGSTRIPIAKVWEQMNLAYHYDANRIWIVNVGHLKPMEFPIEFFLSLAWDPQRWPKEKIPEFTRLWAERQFGPEYAPQIADIVSQYTKYNGRRKPELLDPDTFSLVNYQEADKVLGRLEIHHRRSGRNLSQPA